MAIITIPPVRAPSASIRLIRGDVTQEYLDGSSGVVLGTKALWAMQFPLTVLDLVGAREWQSALVQLAKPSNQFEITPPGWYSTTNYTGSPCLVNGGSQTGTSLNCYGLPNWTTIALWGDYIEVNGELKMLTSPAQSDDNGECTLEFEPALRSPPPHNDPVELINPKVRMRLLTPQVEWAVSLPLFTNVTINAIEHY